MSDSQARVFYDRFAAEEMWGKDLSVYLGDIYHSSSRYCMIFASREYVAKKWPSFELGHAIARQIEDRGGYIRSCNCSLPGPKRGPDAWPRRPHAVRTGGSPRPGPAPRAVCMQELAPGPRCLTPEVGTGAEGMPPMWDNGMPAAPEGACGGRC